MSTVHTMPVGDTRDGAAFEHEEATTCPCHPRVEHVGGGMVVVHNSFDGREAFERPAWVNESYPSGTAVVKRSGDAWGGAHYRILYPRGRDDERAVYHERLELARVLADWLNGGERSPLLAVLYRTASDSVALQSGHRIDATGPLIDPDGTLCWRIDESADGEIARWELIEALVTDKRPA